MSNADCVYTYRNMFVAYAKNEHVFVTSYGAKFAVGDGIAALTDGLKTGNLDYADAFYYARAVQLAACYIYDNEKNDKKEIYLHNLYGYSNKVLPDLIARLSDTDKAKMLSIYMHSKVSMSEKNYAAMTDFKCKNKETAAAALSVLRLIETRGDNNFKNSKKGDKDFKLSRYLKIINNIAASAPRSAEFDKALVKTCVAIRNLSPLVHYIMPLRNREDLPELFSDNKETLANVVKEFEQLDIKDAGLCARVDKMKASFIKYFTKEEKAKLRKAGIIKPSTNKKKIDDYPSLFDKKKKSR